MQSAIIGDKCTFSLARLLAFSDDGRAGKGLFGGKSASRRRKGSLQLGGSNCSVDLQIVRWKFCISWPRCRSPTEQWHSRGRNRGLYLSFLHFWSDTYKNKPQTTFRAAVWGSMFMLGFLQSQEDSLSPLPVGRALFIVYPADDLFDRWLLAVHEHAYAVNLRPDPRHQYEASVQQADA